MLKRDLPALEFEIIQDSSNFLFLSLVEYKKNNYLGIIDNITDDVVQMFILDYINQEDLSVKKFLSVSNLWYYKSSEIYPLSIELSRQNLIQKYSKILRTFEKSYVSRIVGKPFSYELVQRNIKRRRIQAIPESVEIKIK